MHRWNNTNVLVWRFLLHKIVKRRMIMSLPETMKALVAYSQTDY